jgi:8-oxo-dGTP diphosphatase
MRVVSVAYLVFAPDLPAPVPGRTTRSVAWVPVGDVDVARLAFDHDRVLAAGVERARAKLEYTPLAAAFCDDELTVADLRHVYEAVWGTALDPRNFHRKVTGTPGFLEPVGRPAPVGPEGGRPAALFRRGSATTLHPAMLRPAPRTEARST